uniref:Uncharacterized protein n=1 Tax=Meloidogyne incognita TaxID=6306 RepID=A0A914NSF5_MELIC
MVTPLPDENYPMVVSILRRQFGDGKALREGLIAELLHLQVANNSLFSMRNLREHVERICLQLESPEGSNATQDEIVCGIIRSKLPREALETLIGWEQDDDEWTLAHLRAGLGRIVQRKERLERTITNLRPALPERRPREDDQRQRSQPQDRQPQHRPVQVSRSFVAVQPASNRYERLPRPSSMAIDKGCSLCTTGPEHLPSQCTTWNTPQKRQKRLLEQHRCLNCLRNDHLLNQCQSVKRCRSCRGRHHFIVCMRQVTMGREESQSGRQPTSTSNTGRPTGANSQPLGQSTREVSTIKQALLLVFGILQRAYIWRSNLDLLLVFGILQRAYIWSSNLDLLLVFGILQRAYIWSSNLDLLLVFGILQRAYIWSSNLGPITGIRHPAKSLHLEFEFRPITGIRHPAKSLHFGVRI